MTNDDEWVLWRLSTLEKVESNAFAYQLILGFADQSPVCLVDIDRIDSNTQEWLRVVRGNDSSPLVVSCFIDMHSLLKHNPQLAYIYLCATVDSGTLKLQTLYPVSDIEEVETRELNKIFVQIYPKIPSQEFEVLEDTWLDTEGLPELVTRIQAQTAESATVGGPMAIKEKPAAEMSRLILEPMAENHLEQDSNNLEISEHQDENNVWSIFSAQDLEDLIEGFKDWQRVHGRNDLTDQIPASLVAKMGQRYSVAFWTSGQGVSNMVRDHNPPRHTILISLIQSEGEHGIGYCIQRPTSLDRTWSHQKWHRLVFNDSEILQASLIETK